MIKIVLIIIFQLIYINSLFSQYDSYNVLAKDSSFLKNIRKKSTLINQVYCDFDIIHSNKFNSGNNKESGKMYFKKPYNFAWQYSEPEQYKIIVNYSTTKSNENGYYEDYNINNNIGLKTVNIHTNEYYSNTLVNNKEYKISYYYDKYSYLIRLIPLNNSESNYYSSIELFINNIDYGLIGIRLNKTDNSVTSYTFSNRIVNGKINDKIFKVE